MPRVVVGVDGSKESLHALEWTIDTSGLEVEAEVIEGPPGSVSQHGVQHAYCAVAVVPSGA